MSLDAYDVIRLDAVAGVERRRLRPEGDLEEVRAEVERAVDDYQARARLGDALPLVAPEVMRERVLRSITDLGPLTELLARRDVEEIFIEGARGLVPRRHGPAARPDRPDERGGEPSPRRPSARHHRTPAQHQAPDGAGASARRHGPAHRCDPAGRRLPVGHAAALRRAQRHARRSRRPRLAHAGSRRVPRRAHAVAEPGRGLGRAGRGQDHARRRAPRGRAAEPLRPLVRGDPRAGGPHHARVVLRGPTAGARRHGRDHHARPGEVRARDASRSHRRRRGPRRGGVRAEPCGQCRMRLPLHGARQQRRPRRSTRS